MAGIRRHSNRLEGEEIKVKILMVCTEKLPVPPLLGGAIQTYISGILPYLRPFHDITVLGISNPSLPDEETIDGIHYVRVPGKIFEIYRNSAVRYIEANEFDLIHIFNRPRLVLPIREAAPQAKLILSMHNDMFDPEKIDPEEANEVIATVSGIVTVSNYVGNVIRELYPQAATKIRTIYSGVDTTRFLPGTHQKMQKIRNELRKAHGLENKTVILFAGRLSRNKGVDKLLEALPELAKKYKELALVIIGSKWFSENKVNDYVAYVRALAEKLPIPVVTTGFVAPDEIQHWFAAADLFVCTSQWQEPLARVHYEAMAAGLPIVTTARGGNPEVILANENGLVVENPEDPNGFVTAISQLLSDKSRMKKIGEKGRELAVSMYTWDRVASELLEVWEQAQEVTKPTLEQAHAGEVTSEPLEAIKESPKEEKSEQETKEKEEKAKKKAKKKANEAAKEMAKQAGRDDDATTTNETKKKTKKEKRQPFILSSSYTENASDKKKGKGDPPFIIG